jgi:hypothetical protein
MQLANTSGHYRFLKGIEPYSCGVAADPDWEIVRVALREPVGWREGFDLADRCLRDSGVGRAALCAMELRSPAPFTMEGFIGFNRGYRTVIEEWNLLVDGLNPIARTNVAPTAFAPGEPSLHAFSYVRPNPSSARPTFVIAGAGELRDGILESDRIVRRGDVSPQAMLEKAAYVLEVMDERLAGLGVDWSGVTSVNVYTAHPWDEKLRDLLLERIGAASRRGVCWHWTRPPVVGIEFEMDVRGVAHETVV